MQIPDDLFEEGVNPLAQQASSRAGGSKARRRRRRRVSSEFLAGSETGSVDASMMSASSSDLGSAQNSPQKGRAGRSKGQSRSRGRSDSHSSLETWGQRDNSPKKSPRLGVGVGTYHAKSPSMSSISGSRSPSIQNSPMSRSTPVRALAPVPFLSLDVGESGIKGNLDVTTPLDVLQETEERPWTSLTAAGGPGGDESWRRGASREAIDSWRMAGELNGAVWKLGSDADMREGGDGSASAGQGLLGILESEGVNVD